MTAPIQWLVVKRDRLMDARVWLLWRGYYNHAWWPSASGKRLHVWGW